MLLTFKRKYNVKWNIIKTIKYISYTFLNTIKRRETETRQKLRYESILNTIIKVIILGKSTPGLT